MKRNRWDKVIWLLVIVIIVMLLVPAELTDELLAQIKPGMTIEQSQRLLGEPYSRPLDLGVLTPEGTGFRFTLKTKVLYWKPGVTARVSEVTLNNAPTLWIAKTQLLLVEHQNGVITNTWMFPHSRYGGGLQGCIASTKEYWNQLWK